jgi:hypothetical protein
VNFLSIGLEAYAAQAARPETLAAPGVNEVKYRSRFDRAILAWSL